MSQKKSSRPLAKPAASEPVATPPPRRKIVGEKAFREWVRAWRDTCSTRELAQRVDWSEQLVSGLIHGRVSIGAETAARFGYRVRDVKVFEPIRDDGGDEESLDN